MIYPKEGDEFPFECEKIVAGSNGFILHDSHAKPSKQGFLSFDQIAAIDPVTTKGADTICFQVYLRNRSKPIKIFAHAFTTEPSISFQLHRKDGARNVIDVRTIEGIYVDPSELIAVLPLDGLIANR
jgi:hypothetical protein